MQPQQQREERQDIYHPFMDYVEKLQKMDGSREWDKKFCENSLVVMKEYDKDEVKLTAFVPAYVRCHFRNMTEMDIQNLSCRFIATMNISFHLATYASSAEPPEKDRAKKFAALLSQLLKENLKVTFQNDFVLNIEEDLSTNVSDSDRTIRTNISEHTFGNTTRLYSNFIITREFKFGLRSDILFFPLQQNDLDLVTTLNSVKVSLSPKHHLTVRFNCMNIEMPKQRPPGHTGYEHNDKTLRINCVGNAQLKVTVEDMYMQENDGKQLTPAILSEQFEQNKNNPFFRNVKISFPLRANSTEFGYYNLIENEIEIHYTREKQHRIDSENTYERLKNCLFCRKQIVNYDKHEPNGHPEEERDPLLRKDDRSLEYSYCNAIMRIPMLKASLGTIIQLCIPIFFLSFLGLVEFLYSSSTSGDQVRGQKIGSSTLIVATYISFIYAMRTVIPPTPSWSIFQVAVCILAATSLLPIIEVIYSDSIQSTDNPFLTMNGLFIAAFIINASLCTLIVLMLVIIKLYTRTVTKRRKLEHVTMGTLLKDLTQKYFFVWRNAHCYDYMHRKMMKVFAKFESYEEKANKIVKEMRRNEDDWAVRFEAWREK